MQFCIYELEDPTSSKLEELEIEDLPIQEAPRRLTGPFRAFRQLIMRSLGCLKRSLQRSL